MPKPKKSQKKKKGGSSVITIDNLDVLIFLTKDGYLYKFDKSNGLKEDIIKLFKKDEPLNIEYDDVFYETNYGSKNETLYAFKQTNEDKFLIIIDGIDDSNLNEYKGHKLKNMEGLREIFENYFGIIFW